MRSNVKKSHYGKTVCHASLAHFVIPYGSSLKPPSPRCSGVLHHQRGSTAVVLSLPCLQIPQVVQSRSSLQHLKELRAAIRSSSNQRRTRWTHLPRSCTPCCSLLPCYVHKSRHPRSLRSSLRYTPLGDSPIALVLSEIQFTAFPRASRYTLPAASTSKTHETFASVQVLCQSPSVSLRRKIIR